MKKTIGFVLAALMFLSFLVGCNTYRTVDPGVVHRDGHTTRADYHYRHDGVVTDRGVRDTTARSRSNYHHDRTDRHHIYRNDGIVTDRDGHIGNGSFADRPAVNRHSGRSAVPFRMDGYQGDGLVRGVPVPSVGTTTPAPRTTPSTSPAPATTAR